MCFRYLSKSFIVVSAVRTSGTLHARLGDVIHVWFKTSGGLARNHITRFGAPRISECGKIAKRVLPNTVEF